MWLLVPQSGTPEPCPGCGAVSDEKAAICKNCRHVYQPLKAYEMGLIEYGHVSMERLSAEERRKAIQIRNDREKAKRQAEEKGCLENTIDSNPNIGRPTAAHRRVMR